MSFSSSANDIQLLDSVLAAQLQQNDGTWTYSVLDLNNHIGNNDGKFDVTGKAWFQSATQSRLEGTVLFARLEGLDGYYGDEQSIDLDLFVSNEDGELRFKQQ